MDYYGYFPTFNFLVIETYIIVTLIGFIGIFFIFWYKNIYESELRTSKGREKNKKSKILKTRRILATGAIAFFLITYFGFFIILENTSTLKTRPSLLEELNSQNKSMPSYIEEKLNSTHNNFVIWVFVSLFYIMILILTTLDIFKENDKEIKVKKRKEKKIDKKSDKINVRKIKRFFGGG